MPIFIRKLHINKFRNFSETDIYFGEYVTAIAGQNGVGKSNILGLVANCIQYKKAGRQKATLFTPRLFRAEFHELFKGSQEYDKSGSNLLCFTFSDGDTRQCRITWQKDQKGDPRFRIIPYVDKPGKRRSSSKKEIAPLYLGLSRLYPFGESDDCQVANLQSIDKKATEWIVEQAEKILSMKFSTKVDIEVDAVKPVDAKRKSGVGFKGDNYGVLSNSAGQDNLGQILLAVSKIKALKDYLGDDFPGAVLIIDELDATLHPASQKKLLEMLISEAKNNGFQVLFTTHSMELLKHLSEKTRFNNGNDVNNIEVNYLTTANGPLICCRNPPFSLIENDLQQQTAHFTRKIKIYTEDAEARWLLRHLLNRFQFLQDVQILDDVTMSCTYATNLIRADNTYFKNILFVLDGDALNNDIEKYKNIVCLPGTTRPETVIMDFLCSDDGRDYCNQDRALDIGHTQRNFQEDKDKIAAQSLKKDERALYKDWFNRNRQSFDELNLFDYWAEKNPALLEKFKTEFITAHNDIAKRICVKILR